jgi:4-amino-4-deoxy-L-arabinose transferase-like glycosyltransferase
MIGVALAALAALLHATTSARYGFFRDELYFIACSKHLAWGYVDQPPLVAFAAWLSSPVGYHPLALRALPALAAALTVYVTVALAGELGGGPFARILAGLATLLVPAYLLLGNVLTTTSFEPLSWTLVVYAAIRIVRGDSASARRWWLLLSFAIVFGAYGKYSIGLLAGGLAVGLMVTPERRVLRSPWPVFAAGIALVLLAPNLLWQAIHGWPIVEVLRGDAGHRPAFQSGIALEFTDFARNAAAFGLEQILYANLVAAPVWLAGIVAPFRVTALRDLRFLSIAYFVVFATAVALGAKGYYIIGIYASLLAVGAVVVESAAKWLRIALVAALTAVSVASMPLLLPILSVEQLIAYSQRLGLTGRDATPPRLIQPIYAEEFGWERLARDVAAVYFSLPKPERTDAAVYADTYGDAGALDFYGPRYGLPAAISSQNSYYLWGTRGYDGKVLIAIGATRIDLLRKFYRSVSLAHTSEEPYKWIVEGPAPIYLCRFPVAPLSEIWPYLRWYGA